MSYEEFKEADSSTRQATHRVSKGIHDKVLFLIFVVLYIFVILILMRHLLQKKKILMRHLLGIRIIPQGHSVTRKLKSDGHVDSMQTLHNLNQGTLILYYINPYSSFFFLSVLTNIFVLSCTDELTGFEQAWNGNAKKHLPGWREESSSRDVMSMLYS